MNDILTLPIGSNIFTHPPTGTSFGFGGAALSVPPGSAAAAIIYDGSIFTDTSMLRYLKDVGAAPVDNADLYGSNHVKLGATQDVTVLSDVSTVSMVYFQVSSKSYIKTTTYTITESFSDATPLTVDATTADLDYLTANPDALGEMWFGSTAHDASLSFSQADMQHYYSAHEGVAGGAYVHDLSVPLGSDLMVNGTFDTDVTGWGTNYATAAVQWVSGELRAYTTAAGSYPSIYGTFSPMTIGKYYRIVIPVTSVTDSVSNFDVQVADTIGVGANESALTFFGLVDSARTIVYFVYADFAYTYLRIFDNGTTRSFDFIIDNVTCEEVSFATISNFTADCRSDATVLNTNYGPTNFKFVQDAYGRPTALQPTGTLAGVNDGRNVVFPLTAPVTWHPLKNWTHIEGDTTSLTVTYEDTTTEVIS